MNIHQITEKYVRLISVNSLFHEGYLFALSDCKVGQDGNGVITLSLYSRASIDKVYTTVDNVIKIISNDLDVSEVKLNYTIGCITLTIIPVIYSELTQVL